jgi:hypothetical protein
VEIKRGAHENTKIEANTKYDNSLNLSSNLKFGFHESMEDAPHMPSLAHWPGWSHPMSSGKSSYLQRPPRPDHTHIRPIMPILASRPLLHFPVHFYIILRSSSKPARPRDSPPPRCLESHQVLQFTCLCSLLQRYEFRQVLCCILTHIIASGDILGKC